MKKILFILSFLGFVCASGYAQSEAEEEFTQRRANPAQRTEKTVAHGRKIGISKKASNFELSIGPRVGLGLAFMSEGDGLKVADGAGFGFDAGLGFNIRFGAKDGKGRPLNGKGLFGVGLEVNYANRSVGTKGDKNLSLNTLDIPLLLQFYPAYGTRQLRNLFIEVGPTFSMMLSSGPDKLAVGQTVYGTGGFKGGDVKMTFGLGYRFNNSAASNGLYLDFRYNLGTSNLAGNFPGKISSAELTIGYLFKCAGGAKSTKGANTEIIKRKSNKIAF